MNIMNIHDLSEYQLYKLKSIDPTLSLDWREVINDIFPQLDKESQTSVYKNILKPRGISVDSDRTLTYTRPNSLQCTIENTYTKNKDLLSIASHMNKIIMSPDKNHNAMELADKIESILGYLDGLELHDVLQDQKDRQKIRAAFLYDLALWIDTITLDIDPSLRKLDTNIIKSYFKEVFIKQQIQGRDFRNWDSSDLSFQELSHLPSFIKQQGKDRKFFIVEGQNYWYLVGAASQIGKNPYSFRRFLHEDKSGRADEFVYLTSIVLDKNNMQNTAYLAHAAYWMTRLYTLDRGVSDTLLKFVNDTQQLYQNYLKPLLREPLQQDGSHPEEIIKERMIKYEKQLSILILQKLPRIIQMTGHDINDQDYLFYHLDQLVKQMSENVQDFRLQPLAGYSISSEIMTVKLIALRRLLHKSRHVFYSDQESPDDHSKIMGSSLLAIKDKLEDIDIELEELNIQEENISNYKYLKENGSFWQKMKLGKTPEYSLVDINQMRTSINEDLFMSIVRLAKTKPYSVVYTEFECNEITNENYRHYAIANGALGIGTLPRVVRLNEDRSKLDIDSVREVVYEDIFKSNQQWHASA